MFSVQVVTVFCILLGGLILYLQGCSKRDWVHLLADLQGGTARVDLLYRGGIVPNDGNRFGYPSSEKMLDY